MAECGCLLPAGCLPLCLVVCVLQAMQMYRDVLKQQSDNIYAVNGLGTCLAELGQMEAAKHAFNEVRPCICTCLCTLPLGKLCTSAAGLSCKPHALRILRFGASS